MDQSQHEQRRRNEVNSDLLNSLDTGDVILFNRKCLKMRDPLTFGLCLGAKLQSKYDHVGIVLRADKEVFKSSEPLRLALKRSGSPDDAGLYVVEANVSGVSVRGLSDRVAFTSSNDVAVRRLRFHGEGEAPASSTAKPPGKVVDIFAEVVQREYQTSLLGFFPSTFFPPDNAERVWAAEKMKTLQVEIDQLADDIKRVEGADKMVLEKILDDVFAARCILAEKNFAHLPKELLGPFSLRVDFDAPGYWIDGHNIASSRDGIFCSELVGRVLQGAGVLMRFPPASSLRPSDFARDGFGNYAVPSNKLLPPVSLMQKKVPRSAIPTASVAAPTSGAEEQPLDIMEKHMRFVTRLWRDVKADKRPSIAADTSCVPHAWVFPATCAGEAAFDLPWRLLLISGTVIVASAATAPLWVSQLEAQHGIIMKGNPMLFVAKLAARSALAVALHAGMWISWQGWKPSSPSWLIDSKFADASHPYYSVVLPCATYGLLAAVLTYPIERAAYATHFGQPIAGAQPIRSLLRGTLTNALLCSPYLSCAWFLWYEGVMQFVLGTPFSLLRGRSAPNASHDAPDFARWNSHQLQGFAAALGLTLTYETVTYPIHTYQRRVFAGLRPPSARAVFSGLKLHIARTLYIFASSASVAWSFYL